MDIKSILPLLMAGNKNAADIMPIINMMTANKSNDGPGVKSDSEEKTQSDVRNELLKKITGSNSGNSSTADILARAMKNPPQKNNIAGITPILGVVNDDILGKMIKYLNYKK